MASKHIIINIVGGSGICGNIIFVVLVFLLMRGEFVGKVSWSRGIAKGLNSLWCYYRDDDDNTIISHKNTREHKNT